jgi:CRP-like cAMP-binding protein
MAPVALQKTAKRFEKDSAVIVQGQPANSEIFFMTKGTAVVEVQGNVVGTLNAGDWFGELAAILGTLRTATVRAVTPCDVLVFKGIDDAGLYESMSKDPKMMRKLIEQLCQRVVETSKRHASETAELTDQAMRYRRAISGTLFALEKLVEKFKSKVMEETQQHLSALSGIPTGQEGDADPKFFSSGKPAIFGS